MKRHGNLYKKIVSDENTLEAYKSARRGKSGMANVRKFDRDISGNLKKIQLSLANKTFRTSDYQTKEVYEPKKRTIYVLPFAPDRIVQHATMRVIEPIWDGLFIHESYACRTGKGIHAGSIRTMEYVRKYRYCLKCDISKFYPSVNHDVLFDIVRRKIKCPDTLWLLHNIIYSVPGGKNVPIGNYTSQWLGNLYLNELDTFVKQECRIKSYLRYCDDFCLFGDDKSRLRDVGEMMRVFLWDRLRLTYSKCDLFPVTRGVDFLGYRHFPKYILLRKSTAKRVRRKIKAIPSMLSANRITKDQARSIIDSYWGWMRWANTRNLQLALDLEALRTRYRG